MAILVTEDKNLKFKQIVKVLNKIQPVSGRLEKLECLKTMHSVYWIMHILPMR